MFDFSKYSAELKYYDSKKNSCWSNENETGNEAIKEFVRLKPKVYSFLVDNSSEHKRVKNVSENIVATISHCEYKDILLNKTCFRHLMNRIQSKDCRIGTDEINNLFVLL